jgi:hypothetical protein
MGGPTSSAERRDAVSRMVVFEDSTTGRQVATAHEYVRRGGRLGGSRKPDPKQLRVGNTVYVTSTRGIQR